MAETFTEIETKLQRQSRDNNADTLTQLKQDWNTGYHMFNAKLARYYSRKQQFTNLIATQGIYQVPIDCVRVMGMTVSVSTNFQPPVVQIRSEQQWRYITSYQTNSNWPEYYYMLGNDEFQLWPAPAQNTANGLRFWYQPQDHDLTVEDTTSTGTGATVTATNGSVTITATSTIFNAGMASLYFQVTGETDNTWYEIISATTNTLTLKTPYVSTTGAGKAWRVGQLSILPQEYADAPLHYSLGMFFSANGNETRSQYHLGTKEKPGMFYDMISDCEESYSSSSTSNVVTGDDMLNGFNSWLFTPNPGV